MGDRIRVLIRLGTHDRFQVEVPGLEPGTSAAATPTNRPKRSVPIRSPESTGKGLRRSTVYKGEDTTPVLDVTRWHALERVSVRSGEMPGSLAPVAGKGSGMSAKEKSQTVVVNNLEWRLLNMVPRQVPGMQVTVNILSTGVLEVCNVNFDDKDDFLAESGEQDTYVNASLTLAPFKDGVQLGHPHGILIHMPSLMRVGGDRHQLAGAPAGQGGLSARALSFRLCPDALAPLPPPPGCDSSDPRYRSGRYRVVLRSLVPRACAE